MSQIFISYARETAADAERVAEALRGLGYGVWLDDELPAHRPYAEVIEERLRSAGAVVVLWSRDAAQSQWVRAEAEVAREAGTLVQVTLDGAVPPLPFTQIQCANLEGWTGRRESPGWNKLAASIADLIAAPSPTPAATPAHAPDLPDKPSIAVLPFADLSDGEDQAYFCDGMVVEIVTALSRYRSLFVIASDSSLTYRGGGRGRRDIARELGVRYLLEGSVRRSADKVRIAVQLIDAVGGVQIWNERFDGTLEDVFALQDTVADAVAGQLAPAIEQAEVLRNRAKPTADLKAYDLYLRAFFLHTNEPTREGMSRGLALLDEAIARDPNYALALAFAAARRATATSYGRVEDPERTRQESHDLAHRALRAGSHDPEVLTFAGLALGNAELVERALELNPGAESAWTWSAWQKVGGAAIAEFQPQLALERFERALRLNPRSERRWNILAGMGWALLFLGRYDDAIRVIREVEDLQPEFEGPAVALTAAFAHSGRREQARAVVARVRPDTVAAMLRFFPHPRCQEIINSGLSLAGGEP